MNRFLVRRFDGRAFVGVQGPVRLDDLSEPQPDLVLLALPDERYRKAHPTPADVMLLVEVARSSLAYDRGKKLHAYARRGVREYWIVDLVHDRIDVYREPSGERYRVHLRAERGEFSRRRRSPTTRSRSTTSFLRRRSSYSMSAPFLAFDHVQLAMPPGREDEARAFYAACVE